LLDTPFDTRATLKIQEKAGLVSELLEVALEL
jgi:hypothetical protein